MKRIILSIVLALAVTACASIPNPLTPSRIDALNASWGSALAVADGYYRTCEQRLIAPSCRTVVDTMHRAAIPIHAKVRAAREYAKDPTLGTTDLIALASSAVDDFKNLQTRLGVK